jgi:N-glycosylase/DNA lyase
MNKLIKSVKALQKTKISTKIKNRLSEFSAFKDKDTKEWFSELCFCILTANSKAHSALKIQSELNTIGFCSYSHKNIRACIMKYKHRFHNNKSKYIILAREHIDIKQKIQSKVKKEGLYAAREWIVEYIKGIGYKEASHFLRNVGYFDLAILDRHILNLLKEHNYIQEKPKTLTKKIYLDIENKFREIAEYLHMSLAELDMYMWYMKTGEVLK